MIEATLKFDYPPTVIPIWQRRVPDAPTKQGDLNPRSKVYTEKKLIVIMDCIAKVNHFSILENL